jgi:lipopolysaccharide heptosyltransferase I
MSGPEKSRTVVFKIAPIRLSNGYTGLVALSDSAGNPLPRMEWTRWLAHPARLLRDCETTLKQHRYSRVVVKTVSTNSGQLSLALKHRTIPPAIRGLLGTLQPAKAMREFRTAVRLLEAGVPTVWPLAGLQKKKLVLTTQSLFISEYTANSLNLHDFLTTDLARLPGTRRSLCRQAAQILASIHKLGLFHRDTKATNFVVCPTTPGQYQLKLADMDGIKRYLVRPAKCRWRPLWRLATSVAHLATRTELFRSFSIYCDLTGVKPDRRREIFHQLAAQVQKKLRADSENHISFRNILIIKPSSLGDIVLALPALATLHSSFPDAQISWLVRPDLAPLLQNHPYLNRVIRFDRRFLGKAWYNPLAFKELLLLIAELRHSNFDAVFDLQGLLRTALFGWLSGCRNRFGMANAREFARFFYTHTVAQSRECVHLVDYYQRLITAAGAKPHGIEFILPHDPGAEEYITRLFAEHDINVNNYAVFVPGATTRQKCWPAAKFNQLAKLIQSNFNLDIIAVGAESDKPTTQHLASLANHRIKDFAGLTTIPQLVALLRRARVVVSNDTGPGHIAAALGVPIVLIFGQVNPARLAPYGRPETVAAIESDRRGMAIRSSKPQLKVQAVPVQMVYEKFRRQITAKNHPTEPEH